MMPAGGGRQKKAPATGQPRFWTSDFFARPKAAFKSFDASDSRNFALVCDNLRQKMSDSYSGHGGTSDRPKRDAAKKVNRRANSVALKSLEFYFCIVTFLLIKLSHVST